MREDVARGGNAITVGYGRPTLPLRVKTENLFNFGYSSLSPLTAGSSSALPATSTEAPHPSSPFSNGTSQGQGDRLEMPPGAAEARTLARLSPPTIERGLKSGYP